MTNKPKVTLGFSPSGGWYHVTQIRGSKPTVEYGRPGPVKVARVGMRLTEEHAAKLGSVADLTIQPYKS